MPVIPGPRPNAAMVPWHNVLDSAYAGGAKGTANSNTGGGADDTAAIQAAYTAAGAAGGFACVMYPADRTYRITSTITVPVGVWSIALGGRQLNGNGDPPNVLWDGAANGTIFDVVSAGGGLFGCRFSGLLITGSGGVANYPGKGIRFSGDKTDSGTIIDNCWFNGMRGSPGHAVSIEGGGSTNFRSSGGRCDNLAGYGYYVSLPTGADFIGVFDQGVNWVGGGPNNGKGFLHLDGEAATSGGTSHVTFVAMHTEQNQDLVQTYAAGVYPSDRQGVVRCGVYPASGNLQHDLRVLGWDHSGASNSHCVFQITSASGTALDAAACVSIQLTGASGLNNFNGADANATGEIRLVGGNIPDDQRWPHLGYRIGDFKWGRGKLNNYEGVRHYVNSDLYTMRGLNIQPCTYANRSPVAVAGSKACFTDSNTTTWGATVAGGGASFVEAIYNGSNWTVVGK